MYYYIGKINFNPSKNSELSFADNPGNMESLRLDNGSGGIAVCSDARIDSRQKMISCSNELNGIKVVFEGTLYNLEEIKRQYIKDDAHIKHFGSIEMLTGDNFFSVVDVAADIMLIVNVWETLLRSPYLRSGIDTKIEQLLLQSYQQDRLVF